MPAVGRSGRDSSGERQFRLADTPVRAYCPRTTNPKRGFDFVRNRSPRQHTVATLGIIRFKFVYGPHDSPRPTLHACVFHSRGRHDLERPELKPRRPVSPAGPAPFRWEAPGPGNGDRSAGSGPGNTRAVKRAAPAESGDARTVAPATQPLLPGSERFRPRSRGSLPSA